MESPQSSEVLAEAGAAEASGCHRTTSRLYRGKAPIASMDAMEDMDLLSGSYTHLSKLSSEGNMMAMTTPSSKAVVLQGLKYRHVGKSGFKVSNLCLGSIKVFSPSVEPEVAEEVVVAAYEHGINYFDICDPCHSDRAERELGRIVRKKGWPRRSFSVSTRVFWHRNEHGSLSRKEIVESVNQSLRNLNLDYIDLLIIHKFDPNCPLEEVLRAVTFLIDSGKVMYWGTARWSPFELFEAYAKAKEHRMVGPIAEVGEYHWFHREKVELYMAELYNKIGLGLMAWSPISFGLTSGDKIEDTHTMMNKLLHKSLKYHSLHAIKPMHVPANMDSMFPPAAAAAGAGPLPAAVGVTTIGSTTGPLPGTQIPNMIGDTVVTTASTQGGQTTTTTTTASTAVVVNLDPAVNKIKSLGVIAEKLGCSLIQLQVAWQVRNQTVQSTTISATTPEQLMEILNSLSVIPKLTHGMMEDIDKILGNKPARPPMISTLQQRWATTGGIPPC